MDSLKKVSASALFFALCLVFPVSVSAQDSANKSDNLGTKLACGIEVTVENAFGLDRPYVFSDAALTPAPAGYKECFIEHYGRHGSRYAYDTMFYTDLHDILAKGAERNVLTDFGKELEKRYSEHFERYMQRQGDLSPLGRIQQFGIARKMCAEFPGAFEGTPVVKASASMSSRSIMSMASFCLGMMSTNPALMIEEETGRTFLEGTNPRDSQNPFFVKRYCPEFPFNETLDAFQDRKLDYKVILSKLFTDVDAACADKDQRDVVRNLYVLVAGMKSIPEAERTDFTGLFTNEEFALMWEVDNYQRFIEYFYYYPKCLPVLLNMEQDADTRIEENITGATLRFGHDHVIMPLFHLLGINGHENLPATPDALPLTIRSWDSCMATNLQLVFYQNPQKKDILFKVLLNGQEASLPLKSIDGCYYKWKDLKTHIAKLVREFKEVR